MISPNDWTATIEVGDVLISGSGVMRIVRSVTRSYSRYGPRTSVSFVIRHPSWTGRPYTVMTSTDLRTLGYRKTKAKAKLGTEFDVKLAACLESRECAYKARDVVGIP
jgi:hypothetical protein